MQPLLTMNPTGKSSTVCEKRCHARNASPGGVSPVGRNVFAATTRAKRSGCSPTRRSPTSPPQSWPTSVDVAQVERVEQRGPHPLDVRRVRVVGARRRLVGAAEADQVGRDRAQPGGGEHRDHRAVEEAPRRLAVHEQHDRRVARALVEVVHAQRAVAAGWDLDVVRRERETGQVGEAVVRGTDDVHRAQRNVRRAISSLRGRVDDVGGEPACTVEILGAGAARRRARARTTSRRGRASWASSSRTALGSYCSVSENGWKQMSFGAGAALLARVGVQVREPFREIVDRREQGSTHCTRGRGGVRERHPAVAALHRAPDRGTAVAADPYRREGALRRAAASSCRVSGSGDPRIRARRS